jgi:hypothetical protein
LKILFLARHFTYMRNFEAALRLLAQQGHQVHVAAERGEEFGGREMLDRLSVEHPEITSGVAPDRTDRWAAIATQLRMGIDYLRYLDPVYDTTPRLRARSAERVPELFLRLVGFVPFRGRSGRRRFGRLLAALEQAIPADPAIDGYLESQRPDAVLITPLVAVSASPQLDYLYAARRAGIPSALCVWSWDHLSSKALIRTLPDRVLVWNPTQRREAIEMHGVPDERIAVTGAQCFDRWFDRQPSRDRARFCADVGLRDDRPFLLWVCSALFRGSPVEAEFVLEWIRALREHGDPSLSDVNILVRPHPSRMKEWDAIPALPAGAVLWGGNPVDEAARADYFDSLHYSAAVAGLNTSAFIEAAIAGRQVYAVLPPEFRDNQEGTIHFHYLLGAPKPGEGGNGAGGLLHTSRTLQEHAAQLALQLSHPDQVPDRSRSFVEGFVRPHGLAESSTRRFADTVTAMDGITPLPPPAPAPAWASTGLRWLVAFAEGPGRRVMLSERGRMEDDSLRAHAVIKNEDRSIRMGRKDELRQAKAREVERRVRDKQRRQQQQRRRRIVSRARALLVAARTRLKTPLG